MVVEIFLVLLLLMAAVDQLHYSSDEKGIVCEKESREEILQRLKEQEARLQLLYSRWKKDIADLEASQQILARSILALNRKIQQNQHHLHKVLYLAAIVLFNHGKQHLQEVTFQHSGEEETDAVFLGEARKGVAFP